MWELGFEATPRGDGSPEGTGHQAPVNQLPCRRDVTPEVLSPLLNSPTLSRTQPAPIGHCFSLEIPGPRCPARQATPLGQGTISLRKYRSPRSGGEGARFPGKRPRQHRPSAPRGRPATIKSDALRAARVPSRPRPVLRAPCPVGARAPCALLALLWLPPAPGPRHPCSSPWWPL